MKSRYIEFTDGNVVYWVERDYWERVIVPFQKGMMPAANNIPAQYMQFNALMHNPYTTPPGQNQYISLMLEHGVEVFKLHSPVVTGKSAKIHFNGQRIPAGVPSVFEYSDGLTPWIHDVGIVSNGCTCNNDIKQAFDDSWEICDHCKRELAEERKRRGNY